MIARYAISIALGTAVTFGLLFIMQLLIATGRAALTESSRFRIVDFVRVEQEEILETKKDKPEKPPEPETPPPDMPQPDLDNFDPSAQAIQVAAPSIGTGVNVGGIGIGVSDGEYLPIVKVAPIYPRRAQSRGLEGYVIVEFTVTRTGTCKDARVVESSNSVFERAAVAAALKFKYKPRVIDGEPVEVPGVRNKITFQLED
jgi:protein TonB